MSYTIGYSKHFVRGPCICNFPGAAGYNDFCVEDSSSNLFLTEPCFNTGGTTSCFDTDLECDGTSQTSNVLNGGYGSWTPWGHCLDGTMSRMKFCDSPQPQNGGTCAGSYASYGGHEFIQEFTSCGSTCSDSVQNGDETGIDCGGSCSACPTCSDSTQNGDETGVDCGGSCSPCSSCGAGHGYTGDAWNQYVSLHCTGLTQNQCDNFYPICTYRDHVSAFTSYCTPKTGYEQWESVCNLYSEDAKGCRDHLSLICDYDTTAAAALDTSTTACWPKKGLDAYKAYCDIQATQGDCEDTFSSAYCFWGTQSVDSGAANCRPKTGFAAFESMCSRNWDTDAATCTEGSLGLLCEWST